MSDGYKKRVEISDQEAFEGAGLRLGDLNWAERITPLLIHHGMNPDILYLGSPKVGMSRDDERGVVIFEDLTHGH